MSIHDVERREQWVANADTMQDAFTFVMEHMDKFPEPSVTIKPGRWFDGDITGPNMSGGDGKLEFEVIVSGYERMAGADG